MVSFQAALSPDTRRPLLDNKNNNNSSKKRKSEDLSQLPPDHDHDHDHKSGSLFHKRSKAESGTQPNLFGLGIQLESSPLPSEWQRCLDIQSGQIHFYNIRTEKRTFDDPRRSPSSPVGHMSLELQLNLPCDSPTKTNYSDDQPINPEHNFGVSSEDHHKSSNLAVKQSLPSWLAVEEEQQQEMMATVCMKCHMLVMLCKSSPACPNCKFMHPIDQGPSKLFKPSLSLLC